MVRQQPPEPPKWQRDSLNRCVDGTTGKEIDRAMKKNRSYRKHVKIGRDRKMYHKKCTECGKTRHSASKEKLETCSNCGADLSNIEATTGDDKDDNR